MLDSCAVLCSASATRCTVISESVVKSEVSDSHYVLGTPMKGPWPEGLRMMKESRKKA